MASLFFIHIFFFSSFCITFSHDAVAVAAVACGEKRQRARWKEGCATTGRLLLTETTRGCSRKIIHEPSREAEFNLALRQRSLQKKRRNENGEKDGR